MIKYYKAIVKIKPLFLSLYEMLCLKFSFEKALTFPILFICRSEKKLDSKLIDSFNIRENSSFYVCVF